MKPLRIFLLVAPSLVVSLASARNLAAATPILLGTQIQFPTKLSAPKAEWDAAEAALKSASEALPGGYVRYSAYGYEKFWLWYQADPQALERERRILTWIKREGMRPLRVDAPHPWPGSAWAPDWAGGWQWGELRPGWLPQLALNAKSDAEDFRRLLQAVGFKESEAAIQDGNEPASGHPGGNPTLPQGTWDPLNLRRMREADAAAATGGIVNVAAAYSMMEHPAPISGRELQTSGADGFAWTKEKDKRAMHFRYFAPNAGSPAAYAKGYVAEMSRRAGIVLGLPWPTTTATRERARAEGVWVTEAYVAQGDCPEPRSESVRLVVEELRAGVPNVQTVILYRWFPEEGFNSGFAFGAKERAAIKAARRPRS